MLRSKNGSSGFSLVEILIAMVILSVGLLAIIGMIVSASITANRNKVDSTASMLADTVLEQLSAKDVTSAGTFMIKDCAGGDHVIGNAAGAAPAGAGAPLNANNDIDFTAGAVANYQMDWVTCGGAGVRNIFDVRWNVMNMNGMPLLAGNYSRLITVSARKKTAAGIYNPAVTLRTVAGTL
jgi:type IV pilus modification protein PilV